MKLYAKRDGQRIEIKTVADFDEALAVVQEGEGDGEWPEGHDAVVVREDGSEFRLEDDSVWVLL